MTGTTRIVTVKADFDRCSKKVNLLQLEDYKKNFQSFWVRMIEQFVPATTIFVSGEKWCNNDELICSEFEECDYDFEYVDSEITVIEYGTDFVPNTGTTTNGGDVTDQNGGGADADNSSGGEPQDSNNGPIIDDGTTVITIPNDDGITEPNSSDRIINPFQPTGPLLIQSNKYHGSVNNGEPQIVFG
jgi:hypothetical protein